MKMASEDPRGLPHGGSGALRVVSGWSLVRAGPQSWKQVSSRSLLPYIAPRVNLKKVLLWAKEAPLGEQREGWISAPILQLRGEPLQPLTLRKKHCWGSKLCQPHHRNLGDKLAQEVFYVRRCG